METVTLIKGKKVFLHNLVISGLSNASIISCQVRTSDLFTKILSEEEVAVFGNYDVVVCYSTMYNGKKQSYHTKVISKSFCEKVPYDEITNDEQDDCQEKEFIAMFPSRPTCRYKLVNYNSLFSFKGNVLLKVDVNGEIVVKIIQNVENDFKQELISQETENVLSDEEQQNDKEHQNDETQLSHSEISETKTELSNTWEGNYTTSQTLQFDDNGKIPLEELIDMDWESLNIMNERADEPDIHTTEYTLKMNGIMENETGNDFNEDLEIEQWKNRPLSDVYSIVFIDSVHFSVCDHNRIRKLEAFVILGINDEGKKEVLTIQIGENESSQYWLDILRNLKKRGVKDILILCADGLTSLEEPLNVTFPKTEYQRCIVHQIRNALKFVSNRDKKIFKKDLKSIYLARNEEEGYVNLEEVTQKWQEKYPNSMKSWKDNWESICPIFRFSPEVRNVMYSTNAIESLNSTYRRLNEQKSVFTSNCELLNTLYLETFEATKKWTTKLRNWGKAYGELSILYEERLSE